MYKIFLILLSILFSYNAYSNTESTITTNEQLLDKSLNQKKLVILDIDNVVFWNDKVIPETIKLIKSLNKNYDILYVSGRPESSFTRNRITKSLQKEGVYNNNLILKTSKSFIPTTEYKVNHIKPFFSKYKEVIFIDDSKRNIYYANNTFKNNSNYKSVLFELKNIDKSIKEINEKI